MVLVMECTRREGKKQRCKMDKNTISVQESNRKTNWSDKPITMATHVLKDNSVSQLHVLENHCLHNQSSIQPDPYSLRTRKYDIYMKWCPDCNIRLKEQYRIFAHRGKND